MKTRLRHISLILFAGLIIGGCGGGNGSSTGADTPIVSAQTVAAPITIDNAGMVPVIGQSSTTSVIYVHNNTNQLISGITYSADTNTENISSAGLIQKTLKSAAKLFGIKASDSGFLNSSSTKACASIPAGQSCPLVFNTPVIDSRTAQGSALVTASYSYQNTSHDFNQIIGYQMITNNTAQGAVFSSGATIHGFGNSVGYATVYMYGSGTGQVYTVKDITANKPGVTITQGNISGMQIQSNYVQAVEVSSQTGSINSQVSGYSVILSAISAGNQQTFSSTSLVSVPSTSSGAILISGVTPLINSVGESGPGGQFYVSNLGNATATLSAPIFPSGVTGTGGTCGSTLAPGGACYISFNVAQAGGSGIVQLPYTGGAPGYSSLLENVVWYNGIGGALLQMSSNFSPLVFDATVGASAVITVTNIGGYDISNFNVSGIVTAIGSASSNSSSLSCSTITRGQSCSFTISVLDAQTVPAGEILVSVSGTYNDGSSKTYTRGILQDYVSNAFAASLSIAPNPATMTIIGDGNNSTPQTLTVSNNGAATATISSVALANSPAYLTRTGGTCAIGTLAAANTCTIIIQLGPNATPSLLSGSATTNVTYGGGQTTPGTIASSDIDWTVQADQQNLSMESVVVNGNASGTGQVGSEYIFNGDLTSVSSGQTIILTYQNQGTNPITITGISNTNSPVAWTLDTVNSTCSASPTLAPGDTCKVVFVNNLATNALAISGGLGASYAINLTVPTLLFNDNSVSGSQFSVPPTLPTAQFPGGGATIYVISHQATVANNTTESLGVVTISNTLANAIGYSPITITSMFESYYTGVPVASSGCSQSASNNVVSQNCVLTPDGSGNAVGQIVYTINPLFSNESLSLNVLYSINPGGQTVSMTPLAQQLPLQ